jgi:hypothetical protein
MQREVIYVRNLDSGGLSETEFRKLPKLERQAWHWRRVVRESRPDLSRFKEEQVRRSPDVAMN